MKRRIIGALLLVVGGSVPLAGESRWDVGAEWVSSSDVDLWQFNTNGRWEMPERGLSGDLSVAINDFAADYEPVAFDFLGESIGLDERSIALQSLTRWRWKENLELTFSSGLYDGYTNYRSIWLAEYYRQQFAERVGVPGDAYEEPKPNGSGGGVGLRWEYARATGFLEFTVSARKDEVAPGYEIDFDGLRRSRRELNGTSFVLASENIISERLRSRVEVQASRVSERDWRYSGQFSLNSAIGENVVLRLLTGGATENPQFEAWYGGVTLDWALNDHWALFAEGRYYEDNGEIENALLFTAAAPGLESTQGSVGVRWTGERSVLRLKIGRSRGDYESPDPRLDFFQNLYADRHWTLVQLSYSHTF